MSEQAKEVQESVDTVAAILMLEDDEEEELPEMLDSRVREA